jgi:hypothetical protein
MDFLSFVWVLCPNSIVELASPLANKAMQANSVDKATRNDRVTRHWHQPYSTLEIAMNSLRGPYLNRDRLLFRQGVALEVATQLALQVGVLREASCEDDSLI